MTTKYWLAYQSVGLGYQTLRQLLKRFRTVDQLWNASTAELTSAGASTKLIERLLAAHTVDLVYRTSSDMEMIAVDDAHYPSLLREIHSPPLVLFVRGNSLVLKNHCVTVVGTRRPSPYGLRAVHMITEPMAAEGMTIVSGLAFGIDAAAHEAALAAKGKTVAVLGSGVDQITPYANTGLGERILTHGGALLSEYPLGTEPQRHHFPQRNRIIAGLSRATVIVEAGRTSGALITARFALEENRELFAVPGPIDRETSAGPNNLLKLGATPVTTADDLREALGLDRLVPLPNTVERRADTADEATILKLLSEPRHVDELVAMSTLETSVVSATLSMLEMKGRIRHLGGMHYIRIT